MTDDELKDWFIKQVGTVQHGREEVIEVSEPDLLNLIRRVRLDEREACAKVADRYREAWRTTVKMDNSHVHHKDAAEKIAAMIRNQT